MKNKYTNSKSCALPLIIITMLTFASCKNNQENCTARQSTIDSLRSQIATLTAGNETIVKNLATFDTLNYAVFNNQDWARLKESHAKDIKVTWPDGHSTIGIDKHIEDLKGLFKYAPNTAIKEHLIRFGSGDMTCVTGTMTGTYTLPVPLGNGKFSKPTGKSFSIPMCTVGKWKDGVMIEEHLFWENPACTNQTGSPGSKKVAKKRRRIVSDDMICI